MKKLFHLTQAGIDELKTEHESLLAERGPVAERIKSARELGDLSENAEYQTAREEQDRLEVRISEVEHIIQNAQVIKKPKGDNKVQLGSSVKLKSSGATKVFQVVGTIEADPLHGKVSDESPIGQALLGKKEGETVTIKDTVYKIADIS
ncbi:transcription elongation factor GreA [Candidatus Saccharibacteria bacterium CG10_big_fil_rev_8_21_14_0_10_47_8]|nr:MAG: transcription elongation factor GreA [Candidatus Saccharibacteria bacterium CG10_big_fil_rev_8_21_14_0_10_47_8]